MAQYYQQNESIGDMLMKAGLTFAQMKKQEEAQKAHNIAQAVNLMAALPKLPENVRNNQQVLQGIDQTLAMLTGNKMKLPKADQKSIWDTISGRAKGMTAQEGGMTPMGEVKPLSSPGEYMPIKPSETPIYGFDKKKGGVVPLGTVPEGAKVMDYGEADKPGHAIFNRAGEKIGVSKEAPHFLPESLQEREKSQQRMIDYRLSKEGEKQAKPTPTGEVQVVHGYLNAFVPPAYPDRQGLAKWSKEQYAEGQQAVKPYQDVAGGFENLISGKALDAAKADTRWDTAKTPKDKQAVIDEYKKLMRNNFKQVQPKYGGRPPEDNGQQKRGTDRDKMPDPTGLPEDKRMRDNVTGDIYKIVNGKWVKQ